MSRRLAFSRELRRFVGSVAATTMAERVNRRATEIDTRSHRLQRLGRPGIAPEFPVHADRYFDSASPRTLVPKASGQRGACQQDRPRPSDDERSHFEERKSTLFSCSAHSNVG